MSLEQLLRIENQELLSYFRKASIEGNGTPQEVAERREKHVTAFLRKYFPPPVAVAKGIIEDSYGARSNSIDCVLLSAAHPRLLDTNGNYSVILADGVDAAIEVKPDIAKKSELVRALIQGKSVKLLRRTRHGVFGKHEDHHLQIPYAILASTSSANERDTIANIVQYYSQSETSKRDQFDFIFSKDGRIFINVRADSYVNLGANPGIHYCNVGDDVLAAFLAVLVDVPKSEPALGKSVIRPYIEWNRGQWGTYHDLNAQLNAIR